MIAAVGGGKRVLVVNDDVGMAQSVSTLLGEFGYDVRLAYDGARGLEMLSQWPADLVLLDLIMPVLDGWSFLKQLRASTELPQPIVLVWSVSGAHELDRASGLGATECLPRGSTGPRELLATIDRLLSRTRAE